MKPRLPLLLSAALLCAFPAALLRADSETEIGLMEKFALAPDREQFLNQLPPGTEDSFFFHALHYQNTKQAAKLEALMAQWTVQFPDSPQRKIMEERQTLLSYEANPKATLDFLKRRFNLRFDQHQEARDQKSTLPTKLDQALISREVFRDLALESSRNDLSNFSEPALEAAVREKMKLNEAQRRALLARITRPNVPGLVDVIATDLASVNAPAFGAFSIHKLLLPDQLDELAQRDPGLFDNETFVHTRLSQLFPNADVNVETDPAENEAWLDRLWSYARNLSPRFNSLKASFLFDRLKFDRSRGVYNKDRFLTYLKLPRQAGYMNPKYLERTEETAALVNFEADFSEAFRGGAPIHDDEPLLRDYLLHFLATEETSKPYATYLREEFLQPLFAEAKLLSGAGPGDKWTALLTPSAYQTLQTRVDLDFAADNPPRFNPADAVSLRLWVKNAPRVIARIYELNALNYFLSENRQLNTDIDIDGLAPNVERTLTFEDAAGRDPLRRTLRSIDFPELSGKRGAWIIELIASGKSSRALVRKGQWEALPELGPAGDMLTVIDEARQPVKDAVVWVDGRPFLADRETGLINVPFTNKEDMKSAVLASASGDFASLVKFYNHDEAYSLDANFHIDREQLLPGKKAMLALRATLTLDHQSFPIALLEDPKLTIKFTSQDNIHTTREIRAEQGLKLEDCPYFLQSILVPENVHALEATLTGSVKKLSAGGEKQNVRASHTWEFNGINHTAATSDGYLLREANGYIFELLGKNGEPIAERAVSFKFTTGEFKAPASVSLSTDEHGRVSLGKLKGIQAIEATDQKRSWDLEDAGATERASIETLAGELIEVPWNRGAALSPANVSLLERREKVFVADRFSALSLNGRMLQIKGLAPGAYVLTINDAGKILEIDLDILAGTAAGRLETEAHLRKQSALKPLQIDNIQQVGESLAIQLRNADADTRIHVAANRYVPTNDWSLGKACEVHARSWSEQFWPAYRPNLFISGRAIGDEYRYILDRRYATIYPGNMLARPGLILNPWELKATALDRQTAAQAELLRRTREAPDFASNVVAGEGLAQSPESNQSQRSPSFDFLASAAPVFYNLAPDKDGMVRLDRKALGSRQYIQVCATSTSGSAWASLALPETPVALRDLRLARNLDPAKAFLERREISTLAAGQTLTVDDARGGELATYDSIAAVYALFVSITRDEKDQLAKFAFIVDWPKLSDEDKRAKYSEFACHELNFFLSRKDPDFFQTVIRPYLANKKERTFLDDYLLGTDLQSYLAPDAWLRLNAAERALLGHRIPGEAQATARSLADLLALTPPDPALEWVKFETGLHGLMEDTALLISGGVALNPGSATGRLFWSGGTSGVATGDSANFSQMTSRLRPDTLASVTKSKLSDDEGVSEMMGRKRRALVDAAVALKLRAEVRPFYRKIGPAKEWAENNYFETPKASQNANLIPVNAFWADYAAWDGQSAFLSKHLVDAGASFTQALLALGALDLPFASPQSQTRLENDRLTFTAGGPTLTYCRDLAQAAPAPQPDDLLLSEHFFALNDRYRQVEGEQVEKQVTDEFVAGVAYGGIAVVTNSSSTPLTVDLFVQIPLGALPLNNTKPNESRQLRVKPYSNASLEYYFYFPSAEAQPFAHYPAHLSVSGKDVARAKATVFKTVEHPTNIDQASWEYVSKYASDTEVFDYLNKNNLENTSLQKIAWRAARSADFWRKLVALLQKRHVYFDFIYSYAALHNDRDLLRVWLASQDKFVKECGPCFDSPLLHIDPVAHGLYEHLEFSPLINQRTHRFGAENHILNSAELAQYRELMRIASYKPALEASDQLAVVYFLFLQDRVEEALARFHAIDPEQLSTRLQYDYIHCYAAIYEERLAEARGVASQYAAYPVNRWRKLFTEVLAQLDEIAGAEPTAPGAPPDKNARPDRETQQSGLAATEPSFDFHIDNDKLTLNYKNLRQAVINYYLTEPEFLFSSNPFASATRKQMAIVKPAKSATQTLPEGQDTLELPLPAEYEHANVLVEVASGSQRKTQTYHANTLRLALVENYGRLELRDSVAGKPVAKAYVKIYARLKNGQVRFYKDGYTDLRGKFDYASLNTSESTGAKPQPESPEFANSGIDWPMLAPAELGDVERLALLISSEAHGTMVREVNPPGE